MRLQTVTSARIAQPEKFRAFCFSIDAIGSCVYIMGPKVGDFYQVSTVDITDPAKMPVVGIIIAKPDATSCIVQVSGVVRGIYGTLTPGRRLLVQDDGKPGHGAIRATSGIKIVQGVGVALSSEDISISLDKPVVTLAI